MRQAGGHKSDVMGQRPIWSLLARFSGPAIISMTTASTYNMVDRMWVGRLGYNELAALTAAFPVMLLFMSISIGTGMGASSLISRNLGAGKHEQANKIAGNAITLSLLIGLLMAAVCLPLLEPILKQLGASDAVMPMAKKYLFIIAAFSIFDSFMLVIGTTIRAGGSPTFPSVVFVTASVTNIILDPFLIFGWGPFPSMGVQGAAVATVAARGIAALIFVIYLLRGKIAYHLHPRCFIPKLKILAEIYRIGLASIVRMSAAAVVLALANRTAIQFGEDKLAVLGVMGSVASFAFMPSIGLSQGLLPLVGYNYGAHKYNRVGEAVVKAGLLSLGWGIMCAIIGILLPRQIMALFNSDPGFLDTGQRAMRIFALSFFSIGLQNTLSAFFQGLGRGIASLVLTSARQVIFLLPALLILTRYFDLTGLWASFPTADTLAIILCLVWTAYEFRHLKIPFKLRYPHNAA
ncbi:MATE family efflux transporter [Chloroflexota bacterium]